MAPSCWFFWAWWLPLILVVVAAEEQAQGCSAKRCGNQTISTPFWLPDMETGRPCGSQDFEVTCKNNTTPVLRSSGFHGFVILDITYEEGSLHVVDLGKLNILKNSESCYVSMWNTSFMVGRSFKIDDNNMNIVFYNCTTAAAAASASARRDGTLVDMRCINKSYMFVHAGVPYDETGAYAAYAIQGCKATVVPVLDTSSKANASDYEKLMSDGFLLTWQGAPIPLSGKFSIKLIEGLRRTS